MAKTIQQSTWYCVTSGTARKYALLPDGRRQIVDFLFPGDFFGLRAGQEHSFTADAIVSGTTIARYPRHSIERLADADSRLGQQIRDIAFKSLSRSQARLLILGRITAIEKVSAFLFSMAEPPSTRHPETVYLPMSRYDIADYLAISVETVSRALSELQRREVIQFLGKHRLRILGRDALQSDLSSPNLPGAQWRYDMRFVRKSQIPR